MQQRGKTKCDVSHLDEQKNTLETLRQWPAIHHKLWIGVSRFPSFPPGIVLDSLPQISNSLTKPSCGHRGFFRDFHPLT
jgi:hypothetical protein